MTEENKAEAASPAPTTAQDAEQKPKATRSKKKKMFALVTPYSLVNPRTKTRFTQNANIQHEEDDWIKAQMKAGLITEVK